MENQISVLNIKLEDAPFYKWEGVMACEGVASESDVAFVGKIQNVYVVCGTKGLIKSVLAYFPDDIKAIDMAPDYNLAVKYYVPQRLVAYRNVQGEIISAAEFMRMYPEVYVQLLKGLKHAHFRTERWPLFRQFETDCYCTLKVNESLVKQYVADEEGSTRYTEMLRVVETDGSLGNCTFESKIIRCTKSGTPVEMFTDTLQANVYQLLEKGYDCLSADGYSDILASIEQYRRDVHEAEMKLSERIEKILSNPIK